MSLKQGTGDSLVNYIKNARHLVLQPTLQLAVHSWVRERRGNNWKNARHFHKYLNSVGQSNITCVYDSLRRDDGDSKSAQSCLIIAERKMANFLKY